jgi:hypothetical protein
MIEFEGFIAAALLQFPHTFWDHRGNLAALVHLELHCRAHEAKLPWKGSFCFPMGTLLKSITVMYGISVRIRINIDKHTGRNEFTSHSASPCWHSTVLLVRSMRALPKTTTFTSMTCGNRVDRVRAPTVRWNPLQYGQSASTYKDTWTGGIELTLVSYSRT